MQPALDITRRYLTLKTHHIHTLPILVLNAHSRCNCRCVMCDIWKANANGQEITAEQLQPHLDTFRRLGVRWVTLTGGEALMHSNLWALCEMLKRQGITITLLSTGILLKKYAAEVVRWCDEVIVSLDGSPAVHDAIRNIPRAFARLAEGIAAVRAVKPDYPISGRCVLQRRNYADLPHIIDAAHELNLDHISFLSADVSSAAFNRPQPWEDERVDDVALSPNEVVEFRQVVEDTIISHAADFASGFVAENPDKLRRLPQYYAAVNGRETFPPVRCNAPWVSAVVDTDGAVRPCFFHEPMGNLYEQPLDQILNSAEAVAFRRGLDMDSNPICRKCVCSLNLRPTAPLPG